MPAQYRLVAASAAIVATLTLQGCNSNGSESSLPEATDANCEPEKVAQILDRNARNKFTDMCARRNNYRPSTPRGW